MPTTRADAIVAHAGLTTKDLITALAYLNSNPDQAQEVSAKLIAAIEDPRRVSEAYYFGTWQDAGHYFWGERGRKVWDPPGPWGHVDGRLNPAGEVQGECLVHHKDGWTALAFAQRIWDTRGGCNSVFLFDATLSFEEAVTEARERFPKVMKEIEDHFELVEVDKPFKGYEKRRGR